MPDHIHLIAHQGHDAIRLGQWIKALKAVAGGLKRREERPVGTPGLQDAADVGRVPPHGVPTPSHGATPHEFTRINARGDGRTVITTTNSARPKRITQMGIRLPEPGACRSGEAPGGMVLWRRDILR